MMLLLLNVALLLKDTSSNVVNDAKIIGTSEYPGGIYKENKLAFMSVAYTKPNGFRTEWIYERFTLGYELPILQLPKLMDSKDVSRLKTTDGIINETLKIRTALSKSGNYTFRIVDQSTNLTVQTAQFVLKIAAAPKDLKVQKVGGGQSRNLQLGQVYDYDCTAKGYPHPTLSWQFSTCTPELHDCEYSWKPILSANDIRQFSSTYHNRQQIGVKAQQIGILRCVANNSEGSAISDDEIIIPSDITDTEILSGFAIKPQIGEIYRGDQFNLTCQMQKTEFQQLLSWSKKLPNGNELLLAQIGKNGVVIQRSKLNRRHQLTFDSQSSNFSNKYILTFNNISKSDAGYYLCKTRDKVIMTKDGSTTTKPIERDYIRSANITVVDDFAPTINGNDSGDTQIQFVSGMPINLQCEVSGGPLPTVIWYKNGKVLNESQNGHISIKSDSLHFAHIYQSDEGEYVCEATNRVGTTRRAFKLTQKPPESFFQQNKIPIILGMVVSLIVLICLTTVIRMTLTNMRREYDLVRLDSELKEIERNQFDPTLPIFDIIDSGPRIRPGYPHCIKVEYLLFDRQNVIKLGDGNFGVVLQEKLRFTDGSVKLVALKRPKCNFAVDQYRMLFKEICLMTYLGKHPNIVNMIGCVINIALGQLYMVMELCTEGSLESLLESVRTGLTAKFCSELHKTYENVTETNRYYHEDFSNWHIIKATLKGYIFHSDLISYAYQIASAMEHLVNLNFIHRDLAARNILLSHNYKVAKIADFGLGHQIYEENYKVFDRQTSLQLPFRWSAPESLIYREFSSGSDVWSFGVLMWEIFTLGKTPFSHVTDNKFDPYKLLSGELKLNRPDLASDDIYQLMTDCCNQERKKRPTFSDAKEQLREEFQRCSPEQFAELKFLLDEIQQKISSETDVQSAENSIFYTYKPTTVPIQPLNRQSILTNIPIIKHLFTKKNYASWNFQFQSDLARSDLNETEISTITVASPIVSTRV